MFLKRLWYVLSNAIVIVPLIFVSISLHEMAHGVVMLLLGVPIKAVYLGVPVWPSWQFAWITYTSGEFVSSFPVSISPWLILSGVEPGVEVWLMAPWKAIIAILVGPLVNLTIGYGLWGLGFRARSAHRGVWNFWEKRSDAGWLNAALTLLIIWNLNLGLLNILPIPPLDGGKVLLALVALIFGPISESTYLWVSCFGAQIVMFLLLINGWQFLNFLRGKQ